jgi:hypothetical protein
MKRSSALVMPPPTARQLNAANKIIASEKHREQGETEFPLIVDNSPFG